MKEPIKPQYIGDGLYMADTGYSVEIAVNHHDNIVATIDINDIDTAINYLKRVKENS